MRWGKLTIKANNELQAPLENILLDLEAQGIEKDDDDFLTGRSHTIIISGFFELQQSINDKVDLIKTRINKLEEYGFDTEGVSIRYGIIDDQTWKDEWEKYYHAQRITRFLTVVPFWEEYKKHQNSEIVIRLDPQQAFGTGTHPTTVLALRALEDHIRGDEVVFDVGTGTGILSIAASLLGVKRVYACDVEDEAIISAKKNLELNKDVNNVELELNSLLDGAKGQADLILANILPEVQTLLLPQVVEHLRPQGKLIMAGIIVEKEEEMAAQVRATGLKIIETLSDGKWVAIIAQKDLED
ncbi:50S ribosomal protein L11 methyltransferase [Liquorilactobacillus mali]|uniref:Ribosomal protein L11 methyltransferase n=1 Tax=Liquorilactobacillus mali KCTC 3596 = DSM 20444 TaxID=1046596 RepID=J0KXX6_9LACO|nr:50S ribosomal protein L11 methyltransferase [Liquorilactobacillus mali]EJE98563.1 ribosomal protein L11 methyltransferase [Liquorilactobacillus mali KCTC 3596 = DSM 20444]KRN10915.1 ribosomal protein L11 methyltransferase [Liquorilactobacillus mali KCTC 3596 = DSM 20444]MDC7952116.1 50S ribosomal protein L11 methyltransferase [Liquorilactobacillus mali]MDV7756955.1 50S ribosomal protein L11 methyltransferase [Liquorilactobacillus mali]QFQ74794.1 50S ribosomal protein L11 methyltransferase [